MKDRSKILAVINTGKKPEKQGTTIIQQTVAGGGGGASIGDGNFLPKPTWDKCWEIKATEAGEEYLFGKLPLVLQYGITMYTDGGLIDLPSLYDGLVIDNDTIYWEETTDENGNTTKVLKAKGGGEGSGEGTINGIIVNGEGNALTSVSLSSDKKSLTFAKDKTFAEKTYVDETFVKKSYVDETFVTLGTYQTISGGKNFTGGLYVNGGEIEYNGSYWRLDGDLLITGGITAFADNYSSTTIMDALVCDEQTITVEEVDGVKVLKVIGGASGGGGNVQIVESLPSTYEENVLYVLVS